jgi:DNA repair exonuclease SbcCD ATPase subunit
MHAQEQALEVATSSGAAANSGNGSPIGADSVGVEKIRDLLFGNQMQDYDRRFSNLEDRFQKRLKDLEAETARSMSAFELNAKKQIESVAGQLRDEKDRRADTEKELERNLRDQTQALEKRLRQLSDQVAQIERDLTERITQESHALREEIKRKNDDTRQAIERMVAELSGVKTDRNLLAGLFVEVAKALNQDVGSKAGGTDPARGWHSS